jgi:hypothetical protein
VALDRRPIQPDHGKGLIFPHRRPIAGAALWVGVDQQHVSAADLQGAGEVGGYGRFPGPAFLVQNGDHMHGRFSYG